MRIFPRIASACTVVAALFPSSFSAANALELDGFNDAIQMGEVLGLETFTLGLWFYRTGDGRVAVTGPGGVEAEPLISKGRREGEASETDCNYFLGIDPENHLLASDFESGSGSTAPGTNHPLYGITSIEDERWYHAAVTYDGFALKIYLNGSLEISANLDTPVRSDSLQHFSLGSASNSLGELKGHFKGLVDNVTVWSQALGLQNIRDLMWSDPDPDAVSLAAHWPLDATDGLLAKDVAGGFNGTLVNMPESSWREISREEDSWIGTPSSLQAWPSDEGGIELSWSAAAGPASSYQIERESDQLNEWEVIATVTAEENAYTDATVELDREYTYRVRALPEGGNSARALASASVAGGPVRLHFKSGYNGYNDMLDVGIRHSVPPGPDSAWNSDHPFSVKYDSTNQDQVLIHFHDIIGDLPNQIPPGSTITKATLRLWQRDSTDPTVDSVSLHRLLLPWFNFSTWNSLIMGISTDGIEAEAGPDQSYNGIMTIPQWNEWDVTTSVQKWANGAPDHGWALINSGSDGYGFRSSESQDLSIRPNLVVEYQFNIPQPPANLVAVPQSESSIGLTWQDQASNESGFQVERRSGENAPWEIIGNLPANSSSFLDSERPSGFLFQYRVRATNENGFTVSDEAEAITDDRPRGFRTSVFQDGLNAYHGTRDIGIIQSEPNSSDNGKYVWVENPSNTNERQALLRFEDIFGEGPGQVPPGAKIRKAFIRIYLGTVPASGTRRPIFFNRMMVPWEESDSWSSPPWKGNGVQPDGVDAMTPHDGWLVFSLPGEFFEVDITPSLQAWADGETNHGWVIRSERDDDYAFYTSDNPETSERPALFVSFDTDPENAAPEITAIHSPLPILGDSGNTASFKIDITDADMDSLDVRLYGREVPAADPAFTVVILPDTQKYSGRVDGGIEDMFKRQTEWVVENKDYLNVAFVLHAGDIVQRGDVAGGQSNEIEWIRAAEAMYQLEDPLTTRLTDGIPYTIAVGNHDQEPIGSPEGQTIFYNKYFGIEHFKNKAYYGGQFGINNDNNYELFTIGNSDFLSLTLEFRITPDAEVLNWADALLKTYPERIGIVTTHHLINPGTPAPWGPYGEAIYENLKDNPNLKLMFGGHYTGEGLRVDTHNGSTIYSILQNYQAWPGGGNGFLRILTFQPRYNRIDFQTYSPWLDQYIEDPQSDVSIPFDFGTPESPFTLLDQVIHDGEEPYTFDWSGLGQGKDYEWYLEIDDGGKTTQSDVSRFLTGRSYADWASAALASKPTEMGRLDDPDKDGLANEYEFFFDLDPVDPESEAPAFWLVAKGGQTTIQYQRLKNPDLEFDYEISFDLVEWQKVESSGIAFSEKARDNGYGSELVFVSIENEGSGFFWRIAFHR